SLEAWLVVVGPQDNLTPLEGLQVCVLCRRGSAWPRRHDVLAVVYVVARVCGLFTLDYEYREFFVFRELVQVVQRSRLVERLPRPHLTALVTVTVRHGDERLATLTILKTVDEPDDA